MDHPAVSQPVPAFAGFVLDDARGALRRPDGTEQALRPKTFALLAFLAARRGRVVSRDALLDAIWPDVTVGDESLTQCVGEARRALGAGHAGMLRTLPKRGYILDAAAEPAAAMPAAARRDMLRAVVATVPVIVAGAALGSFGLPGARAPAQDRAQALGLLNEGRAWAERDRRPAARLAQRELFRRAVAADATLAPAWAHLAITHTDMIARGHSLDPAEDLRLAAQSVEHAIALAPAEAELVMALAHLRRLQPDRMEDAVAAFRRLLTLAPARHAARANLGWTLTLAGHAGEGADEVAAALALAPPEHASRPVWTYFLGMIELFLAREGNGEAPLRRALRELGAGGNAAPVLGLAAALALNGTLPPAERLVRDLRARRPTLCIAELREDVLWHSRSPVFLAQRERLFEGLAAAGLG